MRKNTQTSGERGRTYNLRDVVYHREVYVGVLWAKIRLLVHFANFANSTQMKHAGRRMEGENTVEIKLLRLTAL